MSEPAVEEQPADPLASPKEGIGMIVALVVALFAMVLVYRSTRPKAGRKISEGLLANGWVLYTRDGCGYCEQQAALLGEEFKDSNNIINCTSRPAIPPGIPRCDDPSIKGFPFWFCRRNRRTRTGLQDQSALRQMAQPLN